MGDIGIPELLADAAHPLDGGPPFLAQLGGDGLVVPL